MKKNTATAICVTIVLMLVGFSSEAQKKKINLKDSLDHKFDLSDYVIDAKGFIPVPYIITEPALGGFGLALFGIFIEKNAPYVDSINGKQVRTPVAPDVSGVGGFYTANNTWGAFAFRSGTLVKSRIKYTLGGGYTNINMSFYETFERLGEVEMKFNIKAYPVFAQASRRIGYSHWYAGAKYLFFKSQLQYEGDGLPDSITKAYELSKIISQPGALVELDNRDNIFTPNKGMKVHVDGSRSDNIFGSDYDYWRMNYYAYIYHPLGNNLIGGFRIDGQQVIGDAPFYMHPYIDMRGVPAERYQGKADILTEGELRWDFWHRWSAMLFGGTGKAFDDWSDFGSTEWVWTAGTGFRYLMARKFGLRAGVDVARGPESWAYYIVFGSNWLK